MHGKRDAHPTPAEMAKLPSHLLLLLLPFFAVVGTHANGIRPDSFWFSFGNIFGRHGEPRISFGGGEGAGIRGFFGRQAQKPDFQTGFKGLWRIHNMNAGVSAMQLQLMPNNKVVWFDTTNLGPSALGFKPKFCRPLPNNTKEFDCFAHAVEYDAETGHVRPLKLMSDPWCSCGGLASNGELINIGGALEALKAVRLYKTSKNCNFRENVVALGEDRWYSSQHMLEDGSFAVLGGRGVFSYELFPANVLKFKPKVFQLPFFKETSDEKENNLYPFVYLLPDGNLFVFANSKSIILNPFTGATIKRLPELPGGARNYPASGQSVMLPLDLTTGYPTVEIMVCGGNTKDALKYSEFPPRKFIPALRDCNRIIPTEFFPVWKTEEMPSGRVMSDALILPNGEVLMLGGAKAGTSAWEAADEANFTPVLYRPRATPGDRFTELKPTQIARMYHSSSALLPSGEILVAGSNPHQFYTFGVEYPTELRVEKFTPPYLDPALDLHRPVIVEGRSDKQLSYGRNFVVAFDLAEKIGEGDLKVTMYPPPFTTHGFSQGQRLLILKVAEVANGRITAVAPGSGKIAPPGYYMLFVVHRGVPSTAMWVHII